MRQARSLGTVLKAMVVAGLVAGATLAAFHSFLTEPVIDQAIAFEEAQAEHEEKAAPPVARDTQKAGLVVGSVLYGVFVGLIFGGVYYLAQPALPGGRALTRAVLLALAAYWLVALLPFLKYPANPPGVGQPETIEYRQALYVGFLLLSIVGGLAAARLGRRARPRWLVAVGYAVFAFALYVLMPANPDPVSMATEVVSSFRLLSVVGLSLFWLVLGLGFGLLVERLEPNDEGRRLQPSPA
jgi:predicted cobalt transporter CbtA